MELYPPDSPAETSCQIPYTQATSSQRALALAIVQEELTTYNFSGPGTTFDLDSRAALDEQECQETAQLRTENEKQ